MYISNSFLYNTVRKKHRTHHRSESGMEVEVVLYPYGTGSGQVQPRTQSAEEKIMSSGPYTLKISVCLSSIK